MNTFLIAYEVTPEYERTIPAFVPEHIYSGTELEEIADDFADAGETGFPTIYANGWSYDQTQVLAQALSGESISDQPFVIIQNIIVIAEKWGVEIYVPPTAAPAA